VSNIQQQPDGHGLQLNHQENYSKKINQEQYDEPKQCETLCFIFVLSYFIQFLVLRVRFNGFVFLGSSILVLRVRVFGFVHTEHIYH
jgi:hypothetical protein